MPKRKSPKEVIESSSNPEKESMYIKFPGKELEPISRKRNKYYVKPDFKKARELWEENWKDKYTSVHTHPNPYHSRGREVDINPMPSPTDLLGFLTDDSEKSMVIAQRDVNSGDVQGYFIIRKTKQTPSFGKQALNDNLINKIKRLFRDNSKVRELKRHLRSYAGAVDMAHLIPFFGTPEAKSDFEEIVKKYNLQYRLISAEGYNTNYERTKFIKKEGKKQALENKVALTTSIIGFLGATFFLSSNFTGNVIANSANQTSSLIGGALFVIGVIGASAYFKVKNN